MNRFLKKFLIFALPVIFLCLFLEFSLRRVPNDYSKKCKYLNEYAPKINTLFLGNSHTFYGIDPTYLKQNSFNASHISQSLDIDHAILYKYENNWDSLKNIVIPIDYFSFYSNLSTGVEYWRVRNYNLYYDIHEFGDWSTNTELIGNFKFGLSKFLHFYVQKQNLITATNLGWGTGYSFEKRQNLIQTGQEAAKRHLKENNLSFESNVKYLNSIIEFAQKRNINVLLFTSPAYKTYTNLLDTAQLNETLKTIALITSKNKNVRYYNLMNDTSFMERDFYDADHLNEFGAKKLTLKMESLLSIH